LDGIKSENFSVI